MKTSEESHIIITTISPVIVSVKIIIHTLARWAYTVAVFGGCTYLVFWRGESGWLFVPAAFLLWFRRGL